MVQDNEQQEQLNGTVQAVTYQNEQNGFAVLSLLLANDDTIDVVGPLAGCVPGEQLSLLGRYTEHRTYGRQFEAMACSSRLPADEGAVLQYLSSGVLPGIGPATARRMVEKFGADALEVLASQPEKLAAIQGFSQSKALAAQQKFQELYRLREIMAALGKLGLGTAQALALYRQHGPLADEMVLQNPYILCEPPLSLPFAQADRIARELTMEPDDPLRRQAALLYTLRHNLANGHTCLPREKLLQTTSEYFSIDPERLAEDLQQLCDEGRASEASCGNTQYVYLPQWLYAEQMAALHIKGLLAARRVPPKGLEGQIKALSVAQGIRYAPLQQQAISEALCRGAVVITGGPGTGKTTTVNAIIALCEQQAERVLLAAPTGRAAKRMSELTGREAFTIHRLLEVEPGAGDDLMRFKRNEKNPLRCEVLIVDELSMVDALLFHSLLAALKPNCRLVMVGDANQLPSVGAGNVLRGILDSGVVPSVALSEIFRQSRGSLIVSNAHKVMHGNVPVAGGRNDDYFFINAYGNACRQLVGQLVGQRLPAHYGFDPIRDIQVLCAGNKGLLGTETLNGDLQQLLNPPADNKPQLRFSGRVFRLGDKVMQLKNNYDIEYTREGKGMGTGAFNGDIGYVVEALPQKGTLTVLFEDRYITYTQDVLHQLATAYAITVHKSQGSEFDAVVMPLTDVPPKLRYRNLLYTALTRAKRLCVLAGEQTIAEQMAQNGRRNVRYSCFASFLQDEDWL